MIVSTKLPSLSDAKPSTARDIQKDVHRLKRSIDDAMATSGEMVAKVIRAGRQAKLTAYDIHPALERTLAAMNASMEARTASLEAHNELRDLSGRLDLDILGWGDLITSPPSGRALDTSDEAIVPFTRSASA